MEKENPFEQRMESLDDKELIEVIRKSSDYQPLAAEAAIKEAKKRKLISDDINLAYKEINRLNELQKKSIKISVGHYLSEETHSHDSTKNIIKYQTKEYDIELPENGSKIVSLRCPVCYKVIEAEIFPFKNGVKKRERMLTISLILLLFCFLSIIITIKGSNNFSWLGG